MLSHFFFGSATSPNKDWYPQLQSAIDTAFNAGGGTVWIGRGIHMLSAPLRLKSRVRLYGQGRWQSTLKLMDGVTAQAVVMTDKFETAVQGNYWNYAAGQITGGQTAYNEFDGLHMGCIVENLCIDGNNRRGATANGLCIYGGGFRVEHVGITDCAYNGLWTQCGRPNNSWAGDAVYRYANMHESVVNDLTVNMTGGHGVLWRGPNDSYLDKVQVKMAKGRGFSFEVGENVGTGGMKIGTIHPYSCSGDCQVYFGTSIVTADYIFCDTPINDGIVISPASGGIMLDKVQIINHNQKRTSESWGVSILGTNNYIGYYRYLNSQIAPGTLHGGALRVGGEGNQLPNGVLYGGGAAVAVKGVPVSGDGLAFKGRVYGW